MRYGGKGHRFASPSSRQWLRCPPFRVREGRMAKFDKSKLPSRHVTVGPERAPHRAFYYAMGVAEAEITQPLVGVVTTWNEAAPCNIALARQAQVVKKGVKAAGGTPRDVTHLT